MPNMSQFKTPVPVQKASDRKSNYGEVELGYTLEQAKTEADRCLRCSHAPCKKMCPVNVSIPEFIECISNNETDNALKIIMKTNALPAICGRICPQENQCEGTCVRGVKGEPVAIGRLERYVADNGRYYDGKKATPNGMKMAVVGSGPAGLSCANTLCEMGYTVTVFEAFHIPGGVLSYGIPEFRLPKDIVNEEIERLIKKGVTIETNIIIGKTMTIDNLFEEEYKAVFIGTGAGLPSFLGIEGENLNGVFSANEFLTRMNLMKAHENEYDTPVIKGKSIAVIGGGNVAMDAARSALRLGYEKVYIIYRRSMDEIPARRDEIHHAAEEGVIFEILSMPVRIINDGNGWVNGIECVKVELKELDESGRCSPAEIKDSNYIVEADTIIIAIGQSPNPLVGKATPALDVDRKGCIITDESLLSSITGVYAGGDSVTGAATVIQAMGAGVNAAIAMDEYVRVTEKE